MEEFNFLKEWDNVEEVIRKVISVFFFMGKAQSLNCLR